LRFHAITKVKRRIYGDSTQKKKAKLRKNAKSTIKQIKAELDKRLECPDNGERDKKTFRVLRRF